MNETAARARTLERFLKAKMVLFSMKSLRHFEMGEFEQGARCVNWSCWCIQKSFDVRAAMLLRKAADRSAVDVTPPIVRHTFESDEQAANALLEAFRRAGITLEATKAPA